MKTLMTASLLSLSAVTLIAGSTALADDPISGWKEVSSTSERVYTSGEFTKLQQKYPTYFANVDETQVTNAYIIFHAHHYMGTSICPVGDNRLDKTTAEVGYCMIQGGCHVRTEAIMGEDPCRVK